jgi:hypothetical protein
MRHTTPTFFVKYNKNILTKYRKRYIKYIMDLPKTKEELYGTYYLKEDLIKL